MKLLRQVRAFYHDTDAKWDILFDHRFREIAPVIQARPDLEQIDGSGMVLLPQVVDTHVHFNDPGYTEHEDFAHGTRAAARGGITTVCDMPCTAVPPVTSGDILKRRVDHVSPAAFIDFAFWGGVHADLCHDRQTVDNAISSLAAAGAIGIKVYLTSGMSSFPELSIAQLYLVMESAREYGLRVAVHAEEPTLVRQFEQQALNRKLRSPADYAAYRPALVEAVAIAQVIEVARATAASVHIVHLSSASGLALIEQARADGVDVTAETCPQYLAFNVEDLQRIGPALKTAPAVRTDSDRKALWRGLKEGTIDFVTTDHAPCDFATEKQFDDIWQNYSGTPGVETSLSYLYEAGIVKRGLSLEWLQRITSTAAQKTFDLRLGGLHPGAPATFTLIDTEKPWCVNPKRFASLGKYSPFADHTFPASVAMTVLKGKVLFSGGELIGMATGEFRKRGDI
jgi:allantoinase